MPPKRQEQESLICVPIGPWGIFGERWMTPKAYNRMMRRKERAAEKKHRNKKYTGGGKKKKQENWIIPGILKW